MCARGLLVQVAHRLVVAAPGPALRARAAAGCPCPRRTTYLTCYLTCITLGRDPGTGIRVTAFLSTFLSLESALLFKIAHGSACCAALAQERSPAPGSRVRAVELYRAVGIGVTRAGLTVRTRDSASWPDENNFVIYLIGGGRSAATNIHT